MLDHAKLDPDWLADTLREAPSDAALNMGPCHFRTTDRHDPDPFDADDARRLREKMAKRNAAWTGRDLAADLRAE